MRAGGREGYSPLAESLHWVEVSPDMDLLERTQRKMVPNHWIRLFQRGGPRKMGPGQREACGPPQAHTLSTPQPGPRWQGRFALSFKWFLWFGGWGGGEREVGGCSPVPSHYCRPPRPPGCLPLPRDARLDKGTWARGGEMILLIPISLHLAQKYRYAFQEEIIPGPL